MITKLWRKRLHRPEALRLLLRDAVRLRHDRLALNRHVSEAAQWLLRAQRATPDDGVSGGYSFEDGWIASYPETTESIRPQSCSLRIRRHPAWLAGRGEAIGPLRSH